MKSHDLVEVIVIGSGLAGLTSAVALGRQGHRVLVLSDPDDLTAATPACHGISTIKGILESDAERFGLQLIGHRGFEPWLKKIEDELGTDRPKNVWISGVSEQFEEPKYFQKEFGRIYRRDFIGAKKIIFSDNLTDTFVENIYPGDWWIDPMYLVKILHLMAIKLGVKFENGRVRAITPVTDEIRILFGADQEKSAKIVIVCAGSGTPRILTDAKISVHDWFGVPGYTFKRPTKMSDCCYVKKTSGLAVKGGDLHWGSTSDTSQRLYSDTVIVRNRTTAAELDLAKSHLKIIKKDFNFEADEMALANVQIRWGVRIRSRARVPVVEMLHKTTSGGLWVNTGYYKSGIILSWLMAEKLAHKINEQGLEPLNSNTFPVANTN